MMAAAPMIAPTDLGGDVAGHPRPRELPGDGQPEGDGGVDVVARDVSERVDGGDDDRGEGERDHAKVGHGERRVAVDDDRRGDRSDADEHQERGADHFGGEFLGD